MYHWIVYLHFIFSGHFAMASALDMSVRLLDMQNCILEQCADPQEVTDRMVKACLLKFDLDPKMHQTEVTLRGEQVLRLTVTTKGASSRDFYGNCRMDCTVPQIMRASTEILQAAEIGGLGAGSRPISAAWDRCEILSADGGCAETCEPGQDLITRKTWIQGPDGRVGLVSNQCQVCQEGNGTDQTERRCAYKDDCYPGGEKLVTSASYESDEEKCRGGCQYGYKRSQVTGECELSDMVKARKAQDLLNDLAYQARDRIMRFGQVGKCGPSELSQIGSNVYARLSSSIYNSFPNQVLTDASTEIASLAYVQDGCEPTGSEFVQFLNEFNRRWNQLRRGR